MIEPYPHINPLYPILNPRNWMIWHIWSQLVRSRILKGTPAAAPETTETGEKVTKGMPDPRRCIAFLS